MWFWWFMLVCDLLTPVTMIVGGYFMWKHSPRHINGVAGYRSARSMKNMDTWKFAHEYCGRLWWKLGWIILIPSLLVQMLVYGESDDAIGIVGTILVTVQVIILIASIFPTENALKKTFDQNGNRKNQEK